MGLLDAFDRAFDTEEARHKLPIVEFARKWCGMKPLLWQRVVLKLYAGEDLSTVPDPGYRISESEWLEKQIKADRVPPNLGERIKNGDIDDFRSILLVVGRRGGKSTVIAIAALYTIHTVIQHDNPQDHYGIQQNDLIVVAVAATSAAQSERSPFAKIVAICKDAIVEGLPLADWIDHEGIMSKTIFFQTVRDKHVDAELRRKGIKQRNATLQIHSYHSNVDTLRGGAVIAAIFDEFAAFRVTQKGIDAATYFYDSLVPSTLQFRGDGRTFILSTPQGEQGKFWEIYREVWGGVRQATIGIHMPSWEAWEDEPDERRAGGITRLSMAQSEDIKFYWNPADETFEEAWRRAPASVRREFGAEFEGAEEQWLPSILIINPEPGRGFRQERLQEMKVGVLDRLYVAHADAASKTDAFGLVVVHKEMDHEEGEKIIVDHAVRWYVAPTHEYQGRPYEFVIRQHGAEPAQIYFKDVKQYIKNHILSQFNIQMLTFDQYQSHEMVEELSEWIFEKQKNTIIKVVPFTQQFNKKRADNFEALMLENRIHSYPHPIMEEELRGLRKDVHGRVEKGPTTNDDLYDCISTAAYHALEMPATVNHGFRNYAYGIDPVIAQVRF